MKIILKKVYYCSFCKKRSLRSLLVHESHCTKNPDRNCRMCVFMGIEPVNLKNLIEKYKDRAVDYQKTHEIKEILTDTANCPACTLAVINICKLGCHPNVIEYDYKKHKESVFKDFNSEPDYF